MATLHDHAPSFSRWPRAILYHIVGGFMISWGAIVTATVSFSSHRHIDLMPEGSGLVGLVDAIIKGGLLALLLGGLGPMLAFGGVLVYNRGRKISSRSAPEILRRSVDRPVLYLRSFGDDVSTAATSQMKVARFDLPTLATKEEQVVEVLAQAGPVVAVGRPGEELPELGAARLYVEGNEHEWRTEVAALMQRANLVAVRAGTTGGLLWEIEQAVSLERPTRLVLLIPFGATEYAQFAGAVGHLFPQGLPDWPSTESRDGLDGRKTTLLDIRAIVYFDSRWQGVLSPLKPTRRSAASAYPLSQPFVNALRPVYEVLAIHPKRTMTLRRAAGAAMTVFALTAGLVPGILIAVKIGPALKPLATQIYSVHIFSKTRADRLTQIPGPYGVALRDEIKRSKVVRRWFESASKSELDTLGTRAASGLPRLSDELLESRAALLGTIIGALDAERCGVFIRSLVGSDEASRQYLVSNLLPLIEMYAGPRGVEQWVHINV